MIRPLVQKKICRTNLFFYFYVSVGAAVYTEQLFKSGSKGESFLDQQFWLYFYGILVASGLHLMNAPGYNAQSLIKDVQGNAYIHFFLHFWRKTCLKRLKFLPS